MKIVLIRHASTHQNESNFISGDNDDSGLSPKGVKDAKFLAKELGNNFNPEKIIVTDSIRSKETANIIFGNKIKNFEYNIHFREFNKGFESFLGSHPDKFEMTTMEWERKYNNSSNPIDRLDFLYPSGLKIRDYMNSVIEEFISLINKNINRDIAIVAHNGTIKSILTYVLGERPDIYFRLSLSCGAYSELEYKNSLFSVSKINKKCLS